MDTAGILSIRDVAPSSRTFAVHADFNYHTYWTLDATDKEIVLVDFDKWIEQHTCKHIEISRCKPTFMFVKWGTLSKDTSKPLVNQIILVFDHVSPGHILFRDYMRLHARAVLSVIW